METAIEKLWVVEADISIKTVNLLNFIRSEVDIVSGRNVFEEASFFCRLDEWDALPLHMPGDNNLCWRFSLSLSNLLDDFVFENVDILVLLLSTGEVVGANWCVALQVDAILLVVSVDICLLQVRVALDLIDSGLDLAIG